MLVKEFIMINKYLPYFLLTILCFIIGYAFTIKIENDYSQYFVSSDFLSDSRIIYNEIFTHKGPVYFLFLYLTKLVFGTGDLGYHMGFISTILIYSFVVYSVILRNNPTLNKYVIISIIISLFFLQNTNSSIQIFIIPFLTLFVFFLEKYKSNSNLFYLTLSSFFLSIAVLTRIDSLIYFSIPFFVFFQIENKQRMTFAIIQTILPISIYFILKFFVGFSHIDFFHHNIEFNYMYGKMDYSFIQIIKYLLYRQNTFILLCVTGSILYVHKLFKFNFSIKNLFVYSALIIFIISLSDKNYHILILIFPLLYFISAFIKNKDFNFITISSICSLLVISYSLNRIYTYETLSKGKIEDERLSILNDKDLNNKSLIYGGEGYINFYKKGLNHQSINNWWLYTRIGFEKNEKLIEDHFKGVNSKDPFFINYGLYESPNHNKWLKELTSNTEVLGKIGEYYKLKKREVD